MTNAKGAVRLPRIDSSIASYPHLETTWGRLALRVLFEDWLTLRARARKQRLTPLEGPRLRAVEQALRELGIDAATLDRLSERQSSEADRPSAEVTTPGPSAGRPSVPDPFV